jgi:hypothetical protein
MAAGPVGATFKAVGLDRLAGACDGGTYRAWAFGKVPLL